jgi:hypothetical protein
MTDWPGPHITQNDIELRLLAHFALTVGPNISLDTNVGDLFSSDAEWRVFVEGLNDSSWMVALRVRISPGDLGDILTVADMARKIWRRYSERNPFAR